MDLVGELSPKSGEYSYVLTALDAFTLWLWLVPIVGKSAEVVAAAFYLHVVLDIAGFPTILRTDNGTEFTATLMRELNRLIGTNPSYES